MCTNISQNFQHLVVLGPKNDGHSELGAKKACVGPHFHVIRSFGQIFYDPVALCSFWPTQKFYFYNLFRLNFHHVLLWSITSFTESIQFLLFILGGNFFNFTILWIIKSTNFCFLIQLFWHINFLALIMSCYIHSTVVHNMCCPSQQQVGELNTRWLLCK